MYHSHECRRCGSDIECDLEGCDSGVGPCWEGDNIGCPNEAAEYAAEDGAVPGGIEIARGTAEVLERGLERH